MEKMRYEEITFLLKQFLKITNPECNIILY